MGKYARTSSATRLAAGSAAATLLAGTAFVAFATSAHAAPGPFNPKAFTVSGSANGGSGSVKVSITPLITNTVNIPAIAPESLQSGCAAPAQEGRQAETKLAGINFADKLGVVLADKTVDDIGTEHISATSTGITEESEIEGLSAIGGLISADVLDTTANTTQDALGVNNHTLPGDSAPSGLRVVNLNVFGHIFNGNVGPNTKITLSPGNYVVLNEQVPNATGITVNAIDVHLAALGVFAGGVVVGHAQTSVTPSAPITVQYTGDAYAAAFNAQVSGVSVNTGHIAEAGIGCNGGTATNSIASNSVKLPDGTKVLVSGTGKASVSAGQHSTPDVTSSEDIQNVSLLNGLVTADAIHVTSATASTGSAVTSVGGTTFVNLVVNGHPITANPGPNTKIQIDGIGTVTLNQQACDVGGPANCTSSDHAHLYVNAISVDLDLNNSLNLPVSTSLKVAHADSGLALI